MDAGPAANQAAIGGYMGARVQTGVVGSGYTTALATALTNAGVPAAAVPTLVNGIVSGAINGFVPAALGNLARAPLGTITFNDPTFGQSPDLLATYQTIDGRLWVYGADASMQYLLDNSWTLQGTIGGVNRTQFGEFRDASTNLPLATNSPGLRGQLTVKYQQEPGRGWGGEIRGRYTDAFQVNSGVYNTGYCNVLPPGSTGFVANSQPAAPTNGVCPAGTFQYNAQWGGVPVNMMLDLGVNYRFQLGGKDALWSLTATNLLDNQVPTFAGVPNIGRLVMTRVSYTF
jgi:iron complex outermembrane receptor protein